MPRRGSQWSLQILSAGASIQVSPNGQWLAEGLGTAGDAPIGPRFWGKTFWSSQQAVATKEAQLAGGLGPKKSQPQLCRCHPDAAAVQRTVSPSQGLTMNQKAMKLTIGKYFKITENKVKSLPLMSHKECEP